MNRRTRRNPRQPKSKNTRHFLTRPNPSMPKSSVVNSPYASSSQTYTLPSRPNNNRLNRAPRQRLKHRRLSSRPKNHRPTLNIEELAVAKPVVEAFLDKVGVDTFYSVSIYEYLEANDEGLVTLCGLQSALSRREIYCSMPFIKLLQTSITPGETLRSKERNQRKRDTSTSNANSVAPLFDCGQLINVVNHIDRLQDEQLKAVIDSNENITAGAQHCDGYIVGINAVANENSSLRQKQEGNRPTSPTLKVAIAVTSGDSLALQKMLNEYILRRKKKSTQLSETQAQLKILQAAEKEKSKLKKKQMQLKLLKSQLDEALENLAWEQKIKKVRVHMISRTQNANKVQEKAIQNLREVINHYDKARVLERRVNAQEECYKAKAQLSAYQQKVYIEVDALHQRLKGRLEEIQDGLVVRQLTDVSKKRREDIANGIFFDKNKLENRLSSMDWQKSNLALLKRWNRFESIIQRLYEVTGIYDIEQMVAKVTGQGLECQRLNNDLQTYQRKISKLTSIKIAKKKYYDSIRFDVNEKDESVERLKLKEAGNQITPKSVDYDVMIDKTSSKIRAQKNRLEHLSDRYAIQRRIIAEVTMRVRSMMLLFHVDTNGIDKVLQSTDSGSNFHQNGMKLAHKLIYGLEQSTKKLNKKAEELMNMQASMYDAYSGNNSLASLSYFDQDQTRVRRHSVVSEEEVLNEVDKLQIDSRNIKAAAPPRFGGTGKDKLKTKTNFGVVSIKNLHESEKRNIEKHIGKEKKAQKSRDRVPTKLVGIHEKDYISMVKLSPDLNYMSLKTPLGNNIRVDCQAVDDFENAKKTMLVFDLIRNIHSLLRLKGMNAEKLFKQIDKDNSGSISAVEMWDLDYFFLYRSLKLVHLHLFCALGHCSIVTKQDSRCRHTYVYIVHKVSLLRHYFVGSLFERYINRKVTKGIFRRFTGRINYF